MHQPAPCARRLSSVSHCRAGSIGIVTIRPTPFAFKNRRTH
jgi:hypothetical protein